MPTSVLFLNPQIINMNISSHVLSRRKDVCDFVKRLDIMLSEFLGLLSTDL